MNEYEAKKQAVKTSSIGQHKSCLFDRARAKFSKKNGRQGT